MTETVELLSFHGFVLSCFRDSSCWNRQTSPHLAEKFRGNKLNGNPDRRTHRGSNALDRHDTSSHGVLPLGRGCRPEIEAAAKEEVTLGPRYRAYVPRLVEKLTADLKR